MASCPCLHPTTALQAGRFPLRLRRLESDAEGCCCARVAAGQVPRLRCRRAILYRHDDCAASIPKSRPEIKNHCTLEGINRQKLASIRKSGLEIKNRCTKDGGNREKLASIRKSGPENKNRCIGGGGGVLQAGHLLCCNED